MMVDKIRSMWKRATCRHEVDKLRFVRVVPSTMEENVNGKYEYHCVGCGKMVYKEGPITCEGCAYLRMWNNGATFCARGREMEKDCLYGKYRWWWEKKQRRTVLVVAK